MFGGSNVGNFGEVWTQDIPWQNRQWSLNIQLPPLAAVYFRLERQPKSKTKLRQVEML